MIARTFAGRLLGVALLVAASADARQDDAISPAEFAARRTALASLMDSGSVLVMKSVENRNRSNDVDYRYRQETNFLYLTGLRRPNCYLLIAPAGISVGNRAVTTVLFLSAGREESHNELAPGPGEAALPTDDFPKTFRSALKRAGVLYYSAPDFRFVHDWINGKPLFVDREIRKQIERENPGLKAKAAAPLIAQLRSVKSPAEMKILRKAIAVTGEALTRAMKRCKPGAREYELQAVIEYELTRQGAEYEGFPSIIGSGPNSLILHSSDNRRTMNAGELVVMDVGAEFDGYSADITRTIPVSGVFTEAQRTVYSAVLAAQQEVIRMIKPGIPYRDLDETARRSIVGSGFGKFIRHGVSHPLGLDVHDVLTGDTLRPGMVVTVEPGIYIPPDAEEVSPEFRGIGVRIEDDIAVTDSGHEVLSAAVPKDIAEIERRMNNRGDDQ